MRNTYFALTYCKSRTNLQKLGNAHIYGILTRPEWMFAKSLDRAAQKNAQKGKLFPLWVCNLWHKPDALQW
jgi:hypothetical protein